MSKLHANLVLLFAAALWGFGNIPQKTILDHLDPLSAVGMRCLIGGLMVLPLIATEPRRPAGGLYRASLARISALFAVAVVFQQIGYLGTSVTNASFLVSTSTVMTPIAARLLTGERLTTTVGLAAGLSVVGALLLSGGIASFNRGDAAIMLSAVCFALWMVELGRHAQTYGRPFTAMATQCLGAAVVTLPFGLLHGNLSPATVIDAWPQLLVLGVFSTAVGFSIQTVAQRFTSASHAAVMLSAESGFGALGAALFLGERTSSAGVLGATIMLGAVLYLATSGGKTAKAAA
ncbi:DMT family transporter [Mesorhizobium muleiense]|uniref:DMT family transporter n=1 Tax=Mesorhizobium muleiense TaxID=1004279 RepID=UPI001F1B8CCA|nr:DMT family transporter [Mesorhizobium muleiense]MCF6119682.1 DMT family transporter [Mesorhizobium muleiense]